MEVYISFIVLPEATADECPAPYGLPAMVYDRASRYASTHQQLLSLWGYALLRDAIGTAGIGSMDSLRFAGNGKPSLMSGPFFSIAHSGNMVVCAVCSNAEIGVDIELVNDMRNDDLRTYFSGREWQMAAANDSRLSMLNIWVRKEAILKATGEGIGDDLHLLDVVDDEVQRQYGKWFLCDLAMPAGYAGCIAAAKAVTKIHMEDKSALLRLNR